MVSEKKFARQGMWVCELLLLFDGGLFEYHTSKLDVCLTSVTSHAKCRLTTFINRRLVQRILHCLRKIITLAKMFVFWCMIYQNTNIFAKAIIFLKQCKILCTNRLFTKVVSLHFAWEVTRPLLFQNSTLSIFQERLCSPSPPERTLIYSNL